MFEILVGPGVEKRLVFEAEILVETVALVSNAAVTSDVITLVTIAVGRICVDFNSVIFVDKTAKDIVLRMVKE